MADYKAIAAKFREYAEANFAYADAFPEQSAHFTKEAERWLRDARRVEQDEALIADSRRVLAEVAALYSNKMPSVQVARMREAFNQAVERVFDQRVDKQASPVSRSNSVH